MSTFFSRTDVRHTEALSFGKRWAMSLAGTLSQGLVRFIYSILIGRMLGASVLGTTNAAISLALFLSLLWPTSAGQAATRYVAQLKGAGDNTAAGAIASHLGRQVLLAASALALVAMAVSLFALELDVWTAIFAGVLTLAYSVWGFTRGVQFGAGQIARASLWDVLASALSLALLLGVLFFSLPPLLLLPLAIGYGLYGLCCWPRKISKSPPTRSVRAESNRFVRFGVLGTLASTGLLQLSMVVASLVGTATEAGYYAAAISLATPATMLIRTVSQVLFPSMAEAGGRNDHTGLAVQTDRWTRSIILLMVPLFGSMALCHELIIQLFFGSDFSAAGLLLSIMLLAVMFITIPVAAVNRLNSVGTDGPKRVALSATAGLGTSAIAWIALGPTLGVTGVAIGYALGTIVSGILQVARAWRVDRQTWSDIAIWLAAGILVYGLSVAFTQDLPAVWGVVSAAILTGGWLAVHFRTLTKLRRPAS